MPGHIFYSYSLLKMKPTWMTAMMFRRPNTLISDNGRSNCSTCYELTTDGDYLPRQKYVRNNNTGAPI